MIGDAQSEDYIFLDYVIYSAIGNDYFITSIIELLQKLKKVKYVNYSLQIQLEVGKEKIVELKKKTHQRDTRVRKCEETYVYLKNSLINIFNSDQINLLRQTSKVRAWSDKTIKKSLQLRLACETSGYQMLISHGYPLPSNRTLQRNLKRIDFQPGILHTVMSLLQLKTQTMEDSNKYCSIAIDETLKPSSDELATHALVFALVGVITRWKQVVAYHFTGSSFNKKDVVLALKEIESSAHKSGLIVTHITSDMGPCNQGV
nr:uncharacterized protein LOC121131308 [Lepeophtheirus salmonis]